MTKLAVPVALPAVTVAEITEPTAANAGIELLEQDAVQLNRCRSAQGA
jgi:hypothetical protein